MARKLSFVAVVLPALILTVFSSGAGAVSICNRTKAAVALAIGFSHYSYKGSQVDEESKPGYQWWSKGWYNVEPGKCQYHKPENFNEAFVFYLAIGEDFAPEGPDFKDVASFCVLAENYALPKGDPEQETCRNLVPPDGLHGASYENFGWRAIASQDAVINLQGKVAATSDPAYHDHRACIGDAAGVMQCGRLTDYDRRYLCGTPYDQIARDFSCTKSDTSLQRYETEAYRGGKSGGGCGYAWVRFRCFND